ncbi:hypothetical protein B0H66DRAFT_533141 [Apodospora peruviana]|uniref:Uncharacterized protein n=1 Tax=Apodospora peruviana TaxID=516989 RepID=A0AAE0I6Q3_9PEZI|nr:hypothetical protein B0H66DRAFT_533141 [Apodospora peruviana]
MTADVLLIEAVGSSISRRHPIGSPILGVNPRARRRYSWDCSRQNHKLSWPDNLEGKTARGDTLDYRTALSAAPVITTILTVSLAQTLVQKVRNSCPDRPRLRLADLPRIPYTLRHRGGIPFPSLVSVDDHRMFECGSAPSRPSVENHVDEMQIRDVSFATSRLPSICSGSYDFALWTLSVLAMASAIRGLTFRWVAHRQVYSCGEDKPAHPVDRSKQPSGCLCNSPTPYHQEPHLLPSLLATLLFPKTPRDGGSDLGVLVKSVSQTRSFGYHYEESTLSLYQRIILPPSLIHNDIAARSQTPYICLCSPLDTERSHCYDVSKDRQPMKLPTQLPVISTQTLTFMLTDGSLLRVLRSKIASHRAAKHLSFPC